MSKTTRQRTEADYPLTRKSSCAFCGHERTEERRGEGEPCGYKGMRLNYWYTSPPHNCPAKGQMTTLQIGDVLGR